ncbi:type II toxin-antitoxin system VapC family toxin [Phytoactinopolyspora endophytica]|uniref:type II toxin-antitoxin system VapC family toxin n=1 Tax=Phytoactinopolyspora endophytica TaxID=1642495 RepID=UPI00101DEDE5|nr:type II toxin-antitoxin system VapC family toxin [Phytoactinopolyspora endophytica]
MAVLLDTDTAIALIRDRPASVRHHYRNAHASGYEVWLSSISLFELWYGVNRSRHADENTERLADFLSGPITIADFNELDAARAGQVRAELAAAGTPIGPYDLLIAGQASRAGHTLVSANTREFKRVKELDVENWLTA